MKMKKEGDQVVFTDLFGEVRFDLKDFRQQLMPDQEGIQEVLIGDLGFIEGSFTFDIYDTYFVLYATISVNQIAGENGSVVKIVVNQTWRMNTPIGKWINKEVKTDWITGNDKETGG